MGIVLLGILAGAISAVIAVISGYSFLGVLAIYLGGGALAMVAAAAASTLMIERKFSVKDPKTKVVRF